MLVKFAVLGSVSERDSFSSVESLDRTYSSGSSDIVDLQADIHLNQ